MDQTREDLFNLMASLNEAGRLEDAQAVARVMDLHKEVGQWVACLRCGFAFPTSEAHSRHYTKAHRS